jgi:hypothetical protein
MRMPLEISVTRPQEKYSMRLRYQTPESVVIGKAYPETAFVLENTWNLEVLDLDKKLQELTAVQSSNSNQNAPVRVQ